MNEVKKTDIETHTCVQAQSVVCVISPCEYNAAVCEGDGESLTAGNVDDNDTLQEGNLLGTLAGRRATHATATTIAVDTSDVALVATAQ